MKGRTKFFNYFIACIATLSLATFAACSDDDPETPSGKLVLTASASSFVAGEGNVTFMVTYDGEDVTSQAAITNVTTGEPVENAGGPRQRSASTSSRLFTTAILRIPLR